MLGALRGIPLMIMTSLVALVVSVGGIIWAIRVGDATIGTRGGAIGCAIVFLIFFVGRSTPEAALEQPSYGRRRDRDFDVLTSPPPLSLNEATSQITALKGELARVRGAVAAMLDAARKEKWFLSVASVLSTLVWGFGDLIAKAVGLCLGFHFSS